MRRIWVCAVFLCLGACSQKAWIDHLASVREQQLAIETAQQFRDGATDKIAQIAEPSLKGDVARGVSEVRPILQRAQGPFVIETVNVAQHNGGPVAKTFTLQAGSGTSWAVAEIVFEGTPGSLQLAGFHAWPANSDPSKLNDFRISERGLLGYVWILSMLASVAFCLTSMFLVWRSPWLKHRWLWTLGSLVGFTKLGLNWSTGAWDVQLVNVSLLGAGATKAGPFSPWILTFAIPVVAIVVIVRFLRRIRREPEAT